MHEVTDSKGFGGVWLGQPLSVSWSISRTMRSCLCSMTEIYGSNGMMFKHFIFLGNSSLPSYALLIGSLMLLEGY